jgi:hypothetical protein
VKFGEQVLGLFITHVELGKKCFENIDRVQLTHDVVAQALFKPEPNH